MSASGTTGLGGASRNVLLSLLVLVSFALAGCAVTSVGAPVPSATPSAPPVAPTTRLIGSPADLSDLVGEWTPRTLLGREVSRLVGTDHVGGFSFHARGGLAGGSNGCNIESYHFRLRSGGGLTVRFFATTLVRACRNGERPYPYKRVMGKVASARLVNGQLWLLADGPRQVATFARVQPQPRWVRIELSGIGR